MAGYILYSLDWDRFQTFVNNPTRDQLAKFAGIISDGLRGDDEFEADEREDEAPVRVWPSESEELCDMVKERLARPDWYGDLSDVDKSVWAAAVEGFCSDTGARSVGFRVDHDGIYWDALDLARKQLKVEGEQILPDVALSAFGQRPFRFHPPTDVPQITGTVPVDEEDDEEFDDYDYDPWSMHSMHTPEEVHAMLAELRSIQPAMQNARKKQALDDYQSLVSVLDKLDKEKRMLYVQVDT